MRKTYNPYVVALAATIGGMLFGFDVSSMSAFVDNDKYRSYFNYPDATVQGAITAAMAGGSFFGSLFSGRLSDFTGRKYAVQAGALVWIFGSLVQCTVRGTKQLMLGRFISGIAIGICSSQVPVYIAELSPKRIRGRLVGLFQWAITWGVAVMFFLSYACSFIPGPSESFRVAWALQLLPGLALFLALAGFPESPRWLAANDRWDEAEVVVAHVQGSRDGNVSHPEVRAEMAEIKDAVRQIQLAKTVTVADLFGPGSRLRTTVGISVQVWQQLTGINVMMYYVVYTFAMAGYGGNTGLVSSSLEYVVNMVMTMPALVWIDTWGRRPLLLAGSALMAVWLLLVGGTMGYFGHYVSEVGGNTEIRWLVPNKTAANAILLFNFLFVGTFAPTWGPGAWVYVSEIFPLAHRATANGLCAAANWLFNFLLAMFVPALFKTIQWRTYIIFAVCCLAMTVHVYLVFPETKGKTLEEVDIMWAQLSANVSYKIIDNHDNISDGGDEDDGYEEALTGVITGESDISLIGGQISDHDRVGARSITGHELISEHGNDDNDDHGDPLTLST
ncbi:general substrate transporter [Lipomyces japonicus]|uniref:general substrate transporter n=1 Tax=Lipomyces japonicus TaxID=56871 RepID=UPI0034CE44E8